MSIFKKIFCIHIYKETKNCFLRSAEVYSYDGGLSDSWILDYHLLESECVKCGKIKQEEKRTRG